LGALQPFLRSLEAGKYFWSDLHQRLGRDGQEAATGFQHGFRSVAVVADLRP